MGSTRWVASAALIAVLLSLGVAANCAVESSNPIPLGTVITLKNWQNYKQYMPAGMQALFAGKYFWKMPADFEMIVGPTSHYSLPEAYLDNTAKYSGKVRIKELPDGEHTITGYVAGQPFPNPADPMKGYKILVDVWYRYVPYLICGDHVHTYLQNSYGSRSGQRFVEIYRRLSHISDVGEPINDPHAEGVAYSEFLMTIEPENKKYTSILTLYYVDPARSEDVFLFVPELRRVLRESSKSRCAPANNSDFTYDDFRSGFNGGIARFDATYLRDQQILSLIYSDPHAYGNLANYYAIFFPMPAIGKWEVRNTSVIDTRRVPSQRQGYCYGKQIMYVDNYSYNVLWKDLYDPQMKFFKTDMVNHLAAVVPREGMQYETGNWIQTIWNFDAHHVTSTQTADSTGQGQVNNEACRSVDGADYDNIERYSTVDGLTQVMR